MSTHQSIPKPANAKKKSDILPIPAQSKSHPVIAQPKIESTLSNEEQLAQMRAQREASERLGSTLLTPESVPRTLPPLQPKLTIGQPGDQYEQEADRVARQVVDHINAPPKIQAKTPRNPMSVGERKPSPLDHLPVSRLQRYATGGEMDASPDLESSIQRSRGGGQPLGDGIRARMEGAFGADFSGVRVHTDGTSDQLNQSIQAKAFTTGQDVFFRKGAYNPGSRGGQELLAHELTHVMQQSGEQLSRKTYHHTQPNLIQKLPPSNLPNQSIRYQDQNSGVFSEGNQKIPRAGNVAATLLPTNLLKGSAPGKAHPLGWDWVAQISGKSQITDWVRFHLFNEQLGGLNQATNLVPTTKGDNSRSDWTKQFEEKAKDDLWGRNTPQKPIHIEVEVLFHTQKSSPPQGNPELHKFPKNINGKYWTWNGSQWNLSTHKANLDIDEPPVDPNNVEYYIIKTSKEMLKNRFQLNEWLADRLIDLRDSIWKEKSKISNEQDFYNVIHDYLEIHVGENVKFGSAQKDLDKYWGSLEKLLQNTNPGIKLRPFKGWSPSGTNAVLHKDRIISLETVIDSANNGGQPLNELAQKLGIQQNDLLYIKSVNKTAEDTETIYKQIVNNLNDSTDFDNNIWQKLSPLFSSSQIYFIDGVKEKPVKTNTQKHQELKQIECNLMQKKVQLKRQLVEPLVIDYFEKEAQNTITRTLQQMKQNNSAFKQPLNFQKSGERALESDYNNAFERKKKAEEIQEKIKHYSEEGKLNIEALNYFQQRSATLKEDIYKQGFTMDEVYKIYQDSQLIGELVPLFSNFIEEYLNNIPEETEEQRHAKELFQQEAAQILNAIYKRSSFKSLNYEQGSYKIKLNFLEKKIAKSIVYQAVKEAMDNLMEKNGLNSDISRNLGNSLTKFEQKINDSFNLTKIKQVPEYITSYKEQISKAEQHAMLAGNKKRKLSK